MERIAQIWSRAARGGGLKENLRSCFIPRWLRALTFSAVARSSPDGCWAPGQASAPCSASLAVVPAAAQSPTGNREGAEMKHGPVGRYLAAPSMAWLPARSRAQAQARLASPARRGCTVTHDGGRPRRGCGWANYRSPSSRQPPTVFSHRTSAWRHASRVCVLCARISDPADN